MASGLNKMLYMEDKMNLDKYTEISQAVLRNSLTIANSFSHQHVTCFHLFKAICIEKNSSILALLENSGLNIKELNDILDDILKNKPKVNGSSDIFLDNDLKKVLLVAEKMAFKNGDDYVTIDILIKAVFNKIPLLILAFPIVLILYIILFKGNLSYYEEIIINSNIENVINLHEDPQYLENYMSGFISFQTVKGEVRKTGSISEISMIFNSNESVTRKIVMKEEVISNNLPNQKVVHLNTGSVKNIITYRFIKLDENKTLFFRDHKYEFNTYMKVYSFFMSRKIKRESYRYLKNFKSFVED